MTPGGGEVFPTQTMEKIGTDRSTEPTTPMSETVVPGPEHKQQDTTPNQDDASVVESAVTPETSESIEEDAPEQIKTLSRRVMVLGATVTAVVAVGAAIFIPKVMTGDRDEQLGQEPGISASQIPGPTESLPQPPASGLPMESTSANPELSPLPPEIQKYLDPTVPYTEQARGTETNLDAILASLAKQRDTAINTDRLDILRAMYFSGSDFNPLRKLDEDVMKLTKKNTYFFDSDWQRAAAVKATVPHPSDPTIGSMEVWKVTVQGTDMHRARKQGESYPMPRDYSMTFYLLQDSAADATGNPTEKVWTIAGNYSGADFSDIKDAYAGEIS